MTPRNTEAVESMIEETEELYIKGQWKEQAFQDFSSLIPSKNERNKQSCERLLVHNMEDPDNCLGTRIMT